MVVALPPREVSSGGAVRFKKLKPVLEGVRCVEAAKSGKVIIPLDPAPGGYESPKQSFQVLDEDTGMCLTSWSEPRLYAKVKLEAAGPKSRATSFGKNCRFRDLGHAKNGHEELSCPLFFADRHRQLYVMNARKHEPIRSFNRAEPLPAPL